MMTVSVASASLSIEAAAEDRGGGHEDPAFQQGKWKQPAASLECREPGWGPQDSGRGGWGLQETTHHGSQASWKLFQQATAPNMLVTCVQKTRPRRSWVRRPGPSPR